MLSFSSAKSQRIIFLKNPSLQFKKKKKKWGDGIRSRALDLLGCPLPAPARTPEDNTHFYKATARLTTGLPPRSAIPRGCGPSLPALRTRKSSSG